MRVQMSNNHENKTIQTKMIYTSGVILIFFDD